MIWDNLIVKLKEMYEEVDHLARRLDEIHMGRLKCKNGCYSCCKNGITIFEIEAKNISKHHAKLLEKEIPHEEGKCAFLDDEGACRIYKNRPYVCRTQGYPLRWIQEAADGIPVEMRDICPLNEEGKPIEELLEEECWTIGPFEEKLAELQCSADGGKMTRIALRKLFMNIL